MRVAGQAAVVVLGYTAAVIATASHVTESRTYQQIVLRLFGQASGTSTHTHTHAYMHASAQTADPASFALSCDDIHQRGKHIQLWTIVVCSRPAECTCLQSCHFLRVRSQMPNKLFPCAVVCVLCAASGDRVSGDADAVPGRRMHRLPQCHRRYVSRLRRLAPRLRQGAQVFQRLV